MKHLFTFLALCFFSAPAFAANGPAFQCKKEISDPPVITCVQGLSVNIPNTTILQIFVDDLVNTVTDDNTPSNELQLSMRKSGTGVGFPIDAQGNSVLSVIFDCCELGTQPIEVWAKDGDGNTAFCETTVLIQHNAGNCGNCSDVVVSGSVKIETSDGIEQGLVHLSGNHPALPPMGLWDDTDFSFVVPMGSSFTLEVDSTSTDINPLNGVSTYDLVLISKHILNYSPLTSPYKIIAADANKSGSVTTFDIVELRKLILGIYNELPQNTSWRFVPKAFVFPVPSNPFASLFPRTIDIQEINQDYPMQDFVAIKVGDVNNTAQANLMSSDDRSIQALFMPNVFLQSGVRTEIPLYLKDLSGLEGFQLGLHFDSNQINIESVASKAASFGEENYAFPQAGVLNISWSDVSALDLKPDEPLIWLTIRAKKDLLLSDAMEGLKGLRAEVYGKQGHISDLQLRFLNENGSTQTRIGTAQPNPSTGAISISLQIGAAQVDLYVQIFDINGKLILDQKMVLDQGSQQIEIPASTFATGGVYVWRVQAGDVVRSGRMLRR